MKSFIEEKGPKEFIVHKVTAYEPFMTVTSLKDAQLAQTFISQVLGTPPKRKPGRQPGFSPGKKNTSTTTTATGKRRGRPSAAQKAQDAQGRQEGPQVPVPAQVAGADSIDVEALQALVDMNAEVPVGTA